MPRVWLSFLRAGEAAGETRYHLRLSRGTATLAEAEVAVSNGDRDELARLARAVDRAMPLVEISPEEARDAAARLGEKLWRVVLGHGGEALARSVFAPWLEPQAEPGLCMVLGGDDPVPAAWPWEYLRQPDSGWCPFGALGIRLVRAYSGPRARRAPVPPVKLLVAAASPTDQPGFNTMWCDEEARRWAATFGPYAAVDRDCVAPSPARLLEAACACDGLVFTGHSVGGANPGLYLVERRGASLRSSLLLADGLAGALMDGRSPVSLLVLNSCFSADVALRVLGLGAAAGASLPAIVAMQFSWPVDRAFSLLHDLLSRSIFSPTHSLSAIIAWWRRQKHGAGDATFGVPTLFAPAVPEGEQDDLPDAFAELQTLLPGGEVRLGLTASQRQMLLAAAPRPGQADGGTIAAFHSALHSTPEAWTARMNALEVDAFPVSVHLYNWYAAETGRPFCDGDPAAPALVSYAEARDFCAYMGGRLPTPEEWEWAARRSSDTVFPDLPDDPRRWTDQPRAQARSARASILDFDAPAPWPRAMGALAPEFTGRVSGLMVGVKGADPDAPTACHAPALTYLMSRDAARCAFRCAYDRP